MTEVLQQVVSLLAAAGMAGEVVTGAPASEIRARGVSVAVIALPSSMSTATPESQQLAQKIASKMRSAGFRVVLAGVERVVPLEELAAVANASSIDLALGVRSLGISNGCSAVVVPEPTPQPAQRRGAISQAEVRVSVKQLMASSRAEASEHLARSLTSAGQWCPRKPTKVERYVLDAVVAPTVLVSTASSDTASVIERIPGVVEEWVRMERK
jgi:hypothetical protein